MNTQSIVVQMQYKVQECLQGVQQQLESSFSRIDAFLDQLPLAPHPHILHNNDNLATLVAKISSPLILTLANQVIQEVKPLIILTIQKQIKYNQSELEQQQIQKQKILQDIIPNNNHQSNINPFTYNLIQNNSIREVEFCRTIAINKDNSIVLVGCDKKIKVFEFKQEELKQTQLLSEHSGRVTTLNFMKKQNQLISGGEFGQIIIWSMNQNSQWICQQKMNEHSNWILSLIMNNNEDLIISGSNDKTIKFWVKQNQWVCLQTNTDHTSNVCGLSLNDQQNKLISCGYDKLILIIEFSSQNQKWNVIQKISVEEFGYRLCFISDNVFIFQPNAKEQMHVYEMNCPTKQYTKTKVFAVKSGCNDGQYLFPQQYIKQKCLVVNKNGYYVNLIRYSQNGDFITQQSIQFGDNYIYGQMSEDGKYLMTWDNESKEIQIRKYHQE